MNKNEYKLDNWKDLQEVKSKWSEMEWNRKEFKWDGIELKLNYPRINQVSSHVDHASLMWLIMLH